MSRENRYLPINNVSAKLTHLSIPDVSNSIYHIGITRYPKELCDQRLRKMLRHKNVYIWDVTPYSGGGRSVYQTRKPAWWETRHENNVKWSIERQEVDGVAERTVPIFLLYQRGWSGRKTSISLSVQSQRIWLNVASGGKSSIVTRSQDGIHPLQISIMQMETE